MIITHAGILLQPEVHIQQQISEGLRQGTWGGHGAWASLEVVADGATVLAVGATGGEDRGMGEDGSTSLARAIAVLMVLGGGGGGGGRGVVQIARLVGKEKTQVSRTLKALAEAGLVIRDAESLRYRLGWRLFTLAATAADQQLLALTPHVLRGLVARVRECAHLSVLDGCGLLTLLSESPPWAIQAVPWVGRIAPLHCTSAGRALLFDHTDAEVRALLAGADLAGGGPNAPHAVEEVLARLRAARRRGFAVVSEEFEAGRVAAAVNVSAPKFRLGRSLAAAAGEVKAAADRLSAALAAPGPPGPAGPAGPGPGPAAGPAGAGRGGRGRG